MLSWLTCYIVLCGSIVWFVISIMCNRAGCDVSGVGRVSGICMAGRLFEVMFAQGVCIRLA